MNQFFIGQEDALAVAPGSSHGVAMGPPAINLCMCLKGKMSHANEVNKAHLTKTKTKKAQDSFTTTFVHNVSSRLYEYTFDQL
jgi:hypothetical protein